VGGGVLNWNVTADAPWLSMSPTSGSSTEEIDTVTVYVDIAGLPAGSHTALIKINAPDVGKSLQTVPVTLNLESAFPAENVEFVGRALGGTTLGMVAVQGNYAYLATNFGLMIMDITNPARPIPVSRSYLPASAQGLAVAGNLVYVVDEKADLRIIDVSNPARPVERGFFDTPGKAVGVAVSGNLAYVADSSAGLFILKYTGASSSTDSQSNARDAAAETLPSLFPDRSDPASPRLRRALIEHAQPPLPTAVPIATRRRIEISRE
jgi:hypothetical protein